MEQRGIDELLNDNAVTKTKNYQMVTMIATCLTAVVGLIGLMFSMKK